MPGPRERRVRIKPALAAAITQHLASVAAELPAGVLGAAFAAELLRALEAAALGDHPTLTGKTIELFSRLHKRGFLASVPADQAGRAALKLLAERTPLVRRLHYRRWCFAFGDLHNPTSALHARLGPIEKRPSLAELPVACAMPGEQLGRFGVLAQQGNARGVRLGRSFQLREFTA